MSPDRIEAIRDWLGRVLYALSLMFVTVCTLALIALVTIGLFAVTHPNRPMITPPTPRESVPSICRRGMDPVFTCTARCVAAAGDETSEPVESSESEEP